MEAAFANPASRENLRIRALIERFSADQAQTLERELFKQRKRLADSERSLQVKPTKAALESHRIAVSQIEWAMMKVAELSRVKLTDEDSLIFLGQYAPVMVIENGRRVIKPMRYQCRQEDKPAFYDAKFPGTYGARRDNLEGFWKGAHPLASEPPAR